MQHTSDQWLDNENTSSQNAKSNRTRRNVVRWWFDITGIPEAPADADFPAKDKTRRSRMVSTIAFLLLVIFVIYLPSTIHSLLTPQLFLAGALNLLILPVFLTIVLLNRSHRVFAAGLIVTIAAELAFTATFLTSQPINVRSLYLIQFFIFGELFAVSLLPATSVFFVATYNAAVITVGFLRLPHVAILDSELSHNLVSILTIPIAVQFLVAVITYLWVRGSLRSLARATRAEAISRLEHQIGLQLLKTREEKLRLEETIQRIVQSHVDTLNNKVVVPLSLSEDTKILWPLVNVITSLQRRLRYSYLIERELRQLRKAITHYSEFCYQHGIEALQHGPQTKTDLDMLIAAIVQSNHPSGNTGAFARNGRPPGASGPLAQDNDYTSRRW